MAVAIEYRSRVLTALAVALPVPLLAAAGLSLPLPTTVERLAAKLVPFGNAAALDSGRGERPARGSIVLASGERAAPRLARVAVSASVLPAPVGVRQGRRRSHTDTGQLATGPARVDTPPAETPSVPRPPDQNRSAAPSDAPAGGGGAAAPPAATTQPDPTSAPVPPPSTTPPSPTPSQVVDTVTNTANNTVTTATDTVDTTVGGVVGGVKHP